MALKKSDLYGSLWRSCDELRGGMDASQYKDYILTLLFVKYVTDKAKANRSDLTVPADGSFDALVALKGDREIGNKINKVIGRLAEVNDLEKVIDLADFNDEEKLGKGKEMQDRLSKLVTIFADLDFRSSRAQGDDLLGDAYEYLMRHFATESGKSKGQFYTPAEVSRVVARVVGVGPHTRQDETVYDPTCGSGSLLLKVADETPRGISIYGQEKDNATRALAEMNMILHGVEDDVIEKGDTLTSPYFVSSGQLQKFDYAVANPPFSYKSWSNGLEKEYGRFDLGRPPAKNGDYAFLLHVLASLRPTGKAAIVLPHGVLFRGHSEAAIRKQLLQRGYIKGIIGLPPNLFYGTGISACIVVLDKENSQARTGVFMIDASRGFLKDGPKNRLRSQDVHKIVDVFTKYSEIERYSRMVPMSEIVDPRNDHNLNIPRYIDSAEPEDLHDLDAHLHGGIPDSDLDALHDYWEAFPSLRSRLFTADRTGYSGLAVDPNAVHQIVLDSEEFQKFAADVRGRIDDWFATHRPLLQGLNKDSNPNELVTHMADDLLTRFRDVPLLDEYDVYEQLMTYWHNVVHDDVALVMNDGWIDAATPRRAVEDKDRKLTEPPDLVIGAGRAAEKYKMDLVPPALIVDRYFASAKEEVDALDLAADESAQAVEEYVAERTTEDGLLAEAMDEEKINRMLVAARLKVVVRSGGDRAEIEALEHLAALYVDEAGTRRVAREAHVALDIATLDKYGELTTPDVKGLVLDDKWHATVSDRIIAEMVGRVHVLVERIGQLNERYGETVHDLSCEIAGIERSVEAHLAAMGVRA